MKTTIELPDELMRIIKIRAAERDRKLKDLVADLLRLGLAAESAPTAAATPVRVQLPLVQCAHPADPDMEVTADRAAQILLEQEAREAAS